MTPGRAHLYIAETRGTLKNKPEHVARVQPGDLGSNAFVGIKMLIIPKYREERGWFRTGTSHLQIRHVICRGFIVFEIVFFYSIYMAPLSPHSDACLMYREGLALCFFIIAAIYNIGASCGVREKKRMYCERY